MANFKYFFLIIFLFGVTLEAQNLKMEFTQSAFPVNRLDKIVWADLKLSNDVILKDLKFDVTLSYIQCSGTASPIPARPTSSDGTTHDPSKWTAVTDLGNNKSEFHYWMNPDKAEDYLPANMQLRKIMEFFVKFSSAIPDCGKMKIYADNFRAIGVDGQALTVPTSAEIIINFGDCPDEETILNLSASATVLRTSQVNELDLRFDYLSSKPFNNVSFDIQLPDGWSGGIYSFISDTGRITTNSIGNYKWRVTVIKDQGNFPASLSYKPWFNIKWKIPANDSGTVQFVLNNFTAVNDANEAIQTIKELRKSVDLGRPVKDRDTVKFSLAKIPGKNWFSLDNYRQFGHGTVILGMDIDNTTKNLKAVSFQITMPNYFGLKQVSITLDGTKQPAKINQIASSTSTRTFQVDLIAPLNSHWPPNPSGDNPKQLVEIFLSFTDLFPGQTNFMIDHIVASQPDGQAVNTTKSLDYSIDFKPIFDRFKRGDSDYNFGDNDLDLTDLALLEDYLSGKFDSASHYQIWAFDFNGDGIIDSRDLSALRKALGINSVENNEADDLMIWPNPSNGTICLSKAISDSKLMIYNIAGQLCFSTELSNATQIHLPLSSGTYFWIISGHQNLTGQLILQ